MNIMKKNVILMLTIFLVITAVLAHSVYARREAIAKASKGNRAYASFYNQQVLGTDVISIMNKAVDSNKRNLVEKDKQGIYIDNNKNSIKIDIKFKELDQVITMERIDKVGMKQFLQNYGALDFKCTKIEYHSKTNNVKYMYFEQV